MLFTPIQINNLSEFQSQILDLLPDEAKRTHGVMPMWHSMLNDSLLIQELIKNLNLSDIATHICVVTMSPNSEFPVHIDSGISKAALNIPLLNCEGTYTHWYSSDHELVEHAHHGNGKYLGVDKKFCQLLDTVEMSSPHIVDIGTLHNVVNPNNTWRILLSVRLTNFDFN